MSNDTAIPTVSVPVEGATDGGDRVPDLSPEEALERWLGKLRVTKADSTVSTYYYQLKHFIEFCDTQGIVSIAEVNGWDIETYETHRRQNDVRPTTLKAELGTLKRFFEYCARIELVDEALPEKVAIPDVPREEFIDESRLHTDDAEALLEYYAENDYGSRAHALLALMWYTGARMGGVRGLDVANYHSEEEYIEFLHRPEQDTPLKNKTDGERAVGIPQVVCDILDAYLADKRLEAYDDYGRAPLLTSQKGRASRTAVRSWTYLATIPCLHSPCPHGNEPATCEFIDYSAASQCPSSVSPHQIRTGSITWQLNRGVPIEVVAKRVNTSVRVLKKHYDKPTKLEDLEQRRRQHVDRLAFGRFEGGEE